MYIDGSVVKVASRCNLNCSYCYMYNKGDETYKMQPKVMSIDVIDSLIEKINNYVAKYNKKQFGIVFHGGEPMLAGKEFFRNFVNKFNKVDCEVIYSIQTNGVLLDKDWVELFHELDIHIGISLDVTKRSNDNYRVYHNGKSAYDEIKRGIDISLAEGRKRVGVLSVIDHNEDPKEVYNHLKELNTQGVNLLFQDDNYDDDYDDDLSLGKWLSAMYDLWIEDNKEVNIDQFKELNSLMLGKSDLDNEYYGLGRPNTFILETDGELQPNDPLRVCKNGFTKTPLNIKENEIDELFALPLSFLYYNNHQNLCKKCQECDLVSVCGGGYIINRYSSKNGFDNPTIYCKSIAYFITHVQNYIISLIGTEQSEEMNVERLNWEEVKESISKNPVGRVPFLESFA